MTDESMMAVLLEIRDLHLETQKELKALRATIQPRRTDRQILSRVLPAITGAFGSDNLTVKEIMQNPAINELAGLSHHELGNLFARCERQEIRGLCVERMGTEHNATLWRIVKVCKLPQPLPKQSHMLHK